MEFKICFVVLLILTVEIPDVLLEEYRKMGFGKDVALKSSLQYQGKKRRQRRMTCEALSFPLPFGYYNHAACASYCFATGKNFQGRCELGWCKCK